MDMDIAECEGVAWHEAFDMIVEAIRREPLGYDKEHQRHYFRLCHAIRYVLLPPLVED